MTIFGARTRCFARCANASKVQQAPARMRRCSTGMWRRAAATQCGSEPIGTARKSSIPHSRSAARCWCTGSPIRPTACAASPRACTIEGSTPCHCECKGTAPYPADWSGHRGKTGAPPSRWAYGRCDSESAIRRRWSSSDIQTAARWPQSTPSMRLKIRRGPCPIASS